MTEKKSVSVVLPSFNEVIALPLLTAQILGVFEKLLPEWECEIILVDDNSSDGTIEAIREKFFGNSQVKLIVRKEERGLASAVLRGIMEARSEYVVVMDSDFNHPPGKIKELVEKILDYDIVCYSRYIKGGGMNTDNKLFRYWGSRIYNKFLQIYLGLETSDNLSGFFIARKRDLLQLPTDVIFRGYGEFYFGILYFFKKLKPELKLWQLPIIYEKRKGGESKTRFSRMMIQYFGRAREFKRYEIAGKKVLVTYARNRIAYVSARSLVAAGYEVHAGDCVGLAMTFFSRYVRKKLIYPPPFADEEKFINALVNYVKENNIDILLPSHEESFVIAKHRDKFSGLVKMLIPSYELICLANDKIRAAEYAGKLGITCPKTFRFDSLEDADRLPSDDINFPAVIKLRKTRGSIGLEYAQNKEELIKKYQNVVKKFKIEKDFPLVQEYVDGYGLGVSMLYKNGKRLAIFTHKRTMELPITGGTSVERISVHHGKAEEYAKKLLDSLNWNGVAMVEFRVDKKTDEPYFLEINPRFWGSLYQSVISGVDFPLLVCRTLEDENFEIPSYKDGIRARWFWGGVFVLPSYLVRGKLAQVKNLLNVFGNGLHFDDFCWKDPLPFLINPAIPFLNLITRGKITFETKEEEVVNFNK